MTNDMTQREISLRVMILDELISNSGKQLDCYAIGDITKKIVDKVVSLDKDFLDSNKD